MRDANIEIEKAKAVGADKLAVYQFVSAQQYLAKAREEQGYADYQVAVDLARRRSNLPSQHERLPLRKSSRTRINPRTEGRRPRRAKRPLGQYRPAPQLVLHLIRSLLLFRRTLHRREESSDAYRIHAQERRCRYSLLLIAMTVGCVKGSVLSEKAKARGESLTRAEKPAMRCAPKELAIARAQLEFTRVELRQGALLRANEHMAIAEKSAKYAQGMVGRPEVRRRPRR